MGQLLQLVQLGGQNPSSVRSCAAGVEKKNPASTAISHAPGGKAEIGCEGLFVDCVAKDAGIDGLAPGRALGNEQLLPAVLSQAIDQLRVATGQEQCRIRRTASLRRAADRNPGPLAAMPAMWRRFRACLLSGKVSQTAALKKSCQLA